MATIGKALFNRIINEAEQCNILSFFNKETNTTHLLLNYDGDRYLQFGTVINDQYQYEQRFLAKWKVNKETSEYIGLNNLPHEFLEEEMSLIL